MVDFSSRMKSISEELVECSSSEASDATVAAGEKHLEELMEIVESIDFARDLKSIGGFPVLKALVECDHPTLRWRAAEVMATCCQNNLSVQVNLMFFQFYHIRC
jgi:hsp70-interacting protein